MCPNNWSNFLGTAFKNFLSLNPFSVTSLWQESGLVLKRKQICIKNILWKTSEKYFAGNNCRFLSLKIRKIARCLDREKQGWIYLYLSIHQSCYLWLQCTWFIICIRSLLPKGMYFWNDFRIQMSHCKNVTNSFQFMIYNFLAAYRQTWKR